MRVLGELHAWWHLLAGYGSYGSCVLSQWLRVLALGEGETVRLAYWGVVPVLVPERGGLEGRSQIATNADACRIDKGWEKMD